MKNQKVSYHLPGLFEFYELYRLFLPLFFNHREYFYPWCEIGSIYGAPADCIWSGGRISEADTDCDDVLALTEEYGISARLTFSNSLLTEEHLSDRRCNDLCRRFASSGKNKNGVIVHSELLTKYLKEKYPELYLVSSTTKTLTDFGDFRKELDRPEFRYVVADFRLNKKYPQLAELSQEEKDKSEFLCNECCDFGCSKRRECYEAVSRIALGEQEHHTCPSRFASEGYRFSRAMKNPGFISVEDIINRYVPMGFSNFKIEGRSLGSALILEFLLYYLTKPEYRLVVREEIYLTNTLDLF
ncbi:MAG: hypothetical protein ACI4CS_09140 [Candidatus Weimeria sp.]